LKSTILNNTLITAFERIVLLITSLVFVSLFINKVGADIYGIYLILSMLSIFGSLNIFDLGLEVSMQYYISFYQNHKRIKSLIMYYGFVLYFILGSILATVLYIFDATIVSSISSISIGTQELTDIIHIVILNLFLQFIMLSFKSTLEGLRFFIITRTLNTIFIVIQSVLIILVLYISNSILHVFQIIFIMTLLNTIVLSYFLIKNADLTLKNTNLFKKRNLIFLKKISIYSLEVFSTRIVGFIFNQTDKLLIWKFLTPMWMTIYDIVTKPIMPLRMITQVLNSALIPEVANEHKNKNNKKILLIYLRFVKYAYILIIPISFLLMFYLDTLITVWISEEYAQYSNLSIIIIFTYLALPIAAIAGTVITGLKEVKKTLLFINIAAVINLGLSIYFLDSMGIAGLLLATLIAGYYLLAPYNKLLEKTLGLKTKVFRRTFKLFLFHLPLTGILILAKLYLPNLIGIILSLFLVIIQYGLNYNYILSKKEKTVIKSKIRKRE